MRTWLDYVGSASPVSTQRFTRNCFARRCAFGNKLGIRRGPLIAVEYFPHLKKHYLLNTLFKARITHNRSIARGRNIDWILQVVVALLVFLFWIIRAVYNSLIKWFNVNICDAGCGMYVNTGRQNQVKIHTKMINLVCELNLVCRHKSGVQLFLQVKKNLHFHLCASREA